MSPACPLITSAAQEISGGQCNYFVPSLSLSLSLFLSLSRTTKNTVSYFKSLSSPDSFGPSRFGSVVVWSIAKREAICGSPAASLNVGNATTIIFSRCRDEMFVTAGKYASACSQGFQNSYITLFAWAESMAIPIWGNTIHPAKLPYIIICMILQSLKSLVTESL